jgi:hypothetical protein
MDDTQKKDAAEMDEDCCGSGKCEGDSCCDNEGACCKEDVSADTAVEAPGQCPL